MKYLLSLVLACIFITNAFSQKPVAPAISDSLTDPTWTACTSASPILRYTSSGTSSLFSCTGVGGTRYAVLIGQVLCPVFTIYSQCSSNLNLPTFTPNNTTVTAQGAIAPDGTNNSYAMKEDTTATVEHYSIQGPVSYTWQAGSTHTYTIFARRLVGSRNMQMQLSLDGFTNTGSVGVNLSDCSNAFGPNIGGDVTATYTANMVYPGWCKIQLNVTASGSHTTYYMDFSLINGSTKSYTGDGVSTNAYWGVGLQ